MDYSFPIDCHFLNLPHPDNEPLKDTLSSFGFKEDREFYCFSIEGLNDQLPYDNASESNYCSDEKDDIAKYWEIYRDHGINIWDTSFFNFKCDEISRPDYGMQSLRDDSYIRFIGEKSFFHWFPDVYSLYSKVPKNRIWYQDPTILFTKYKVNTIKFFRLAAPEGQYLSLSQNMINESIRLRQLGVQKILLGNFTLEEKFLKVFRSIVQISPEYSIQEYTYAF
jgi:hypothetical protein